MKKLSWEQIKDNWELHKHNIAYVDINKYIVVLKSGKRYPVELYLDKLSK